MVFGIAVRARYSLLTLSALACLSVGCAGRQGPNPLLAADRVPPPQTRLTTQGGQVPYYQQPAVAPPMGHSGATGPVQATPATFVSSPPTTFNGPEPTIAMPTDNLALRAVGPTPPPTVAATPAVGLQFPPQTYGDYVAQAGYTTQPTFAATQPLTAAQPATFAPAPTLNRVPTTRPMSVTLSPTTSATGGVSTAAARPNTEGLSWVSGSAPRHAAPQPIQPTAYDPSVQPAGYSAPPRVRLPGHAGPEVQNASGFQAR